MINLKKKLHSNLLNIFKKNILPQYRIIIKLKSKSDKLLKKFQKIKHCNIIHFIENMNILCIVVSHRTLSNLIENPEIEYITLDSEVFLCANKSLPTTKKTNPENILYNNSLTGKDICIGIIDSGIYPYDCFSKPKKRILSFIDLVNNLSYPYDDNGHGSAMCNIIGNKFIYKNNIFNTSSECTFSVIKAFDKYNKSYCSLIFKSLDIILQTLDKTNLQILCLPFEMNEFNSFTLDIFQNFFNMLSEKKILIVVPIGNNSSTYSSLKGLSLLNNCITVGGINVKESSCGIYNSKFKKPTIISIYENIYIPNPDTKYISERNNQYIYPPKIKTDFIEYFGTSCSCAYVCSLLSLLKQKNIQIDMRDTLSLLNLCCDKIDNVDSSIQGLGTININQLLE